MIKREFMIIAGPCVFETEKELEEIVVKLKELGVEYIRAGVFKMRTSPDSFQGLREEGMEIIKRIRQKYGVKFVVELTTIEQIQKYSEYIDVVQIGARNMYNYELLKAAGKIRKPILLKRSFSATYNEFINAAKYIEKEGNKQIILCERGIVGFEPETRNTLDIQAVPYLKTHTKYKIFIDPSHSSGCRYMVDTLSRAAIAAGADGLIIETHTTPEKSRCDASQTISVEELKRILEYKEKYFEYFE